MGLAGRKEKQRIGADPRNLSWADNAARFGQAYLSKLGWDSSQGLGASGDGRKSHLKVSQKLDMLGIGAAHQKDPSGIAWKQNKDFENLLKRLNEGADADENGLAGNGGELGNGQGLDGFVRQEQSTEDVEQGKKRKKRDGDDGEKKERKRRKKEREEGVGEKLKTRDKKRQHEKDNTHATGVTSPVESTVQSTRVFAPRPMAHRARFIASKRLASKSAVAISEVLAITPNSASLTAASNSLSPSRDERDAAPLEKLTTSTKSLAEYFKEKLSTKKEKLPDITRPSKSEDEDVEESRAGFGFGFTRATFKKDMLGDPDTLRIGLGAFGEHVISAISTSSEIAVDPITMSGLPESKAERKGKKKEKTRRKEPDATDKDLRGLGSKDVDAEGRTASKEERKKKRQSSTRDILA